jgi:hypothetical protein
LVSGEKLGKGGERMDDEVVELALLLLDTLHGYQDLANRSKNNLKTNLRTHWTLV